MKFVKNSSPTNTISNRLSDIIEHPKGTTPPCSCTDQAVFQPVFSSIFAERSKRGRKGVEKVNNYCIWSTNGKTNTIPSECLFVLIYQLEIVGDESATSSDYYDKFYVKF